MRGDSQGMDNTALDASCRCQAEILHESRESTCLQSTTLQLVQAKCLVPANVGGCQAPPGQHEAEDACGGFCPARPRCRRSNHVCVPDATGVGYHDGNSHCAFLTQSPQLPLANRSGPRAPGREHDQCSHLENLERCRDPLV